MIRCSRCGSGDILISYSVIDHEEDLICTRCGYEWHYSFGLKSGSPIRGQ